jgi:hypothetical protein
MNDYKGIQFDFYNSFFLGKSRNNKTGNCFLATKNNPFIKQNELHISKLSK